VSLRASLAGPLLVLAAAPAVAQEREVRFAGHGDLELRGTLALPGGTEEAVPAVLLLPGSGPTDRNGNQPPQLVTNLLKQLSDRLTAEGMAALRFDKRSAFVHSRDWPAGNEAQGEFFSWEAFVGDARAALAWLQTQPGIDPARTAVLGHSEGGLIALQLGADLAGKEGAPAALVLVGTAALRLDHVITAQIEGLLERQGVPEDQRGPFRDGLRSAVDSIVNEGIVPADLHPGLRALFPPNVVPLLRSYFTTEPLELARRCRAPALVVGAGRDVQVPADTHLAPLADTLASRLDVGAERLLVPGASHNLKPVADVTEPGFTGPVAPEALDGIATYLGRVLAP
jgi:dienelactone hydrolase